MIKVQNVTKTYQTTEGVSVIGLDRCSLDFNENGLVFLLGESGSGKSTLLNIIGGLDTIDSGKVLINDRSLFDLSNKEIDNYRNKNVAFVFQQFNLFEDRTVGYNVSLSRRFQNKPTSDKEMNLALEKVGLKGYENRYPNELSIGQKQRIAIARGLIKDSSVIIADEPTGSLDEKNEVVIYDLLKEISKNKLVIVSCHNEEIAAKYADRIIRLEKGIIQSDSVVNETSKLISEFNIENQIIKSKLFFESAFRRLFSLKTRVITTVLLLAFVFSIVGISLSMKNDSVSQKLNSLYNEDVKYVNVIKTRTFIGENGERYRIDSNFSNDNMSELNDMFTPRDGLPVLIDFQTDLLDQYEGEIPEREMTYYNFKVDGAVEINDGNLESMGLDLLVGRLPVKNENDNEILITKYTFEAISKFNILGLENEDEIKELNDIINTTININDNEYVIVGVLDTKMNDRFDTILDITKTDDQIEDMIFQFELYIQDSFHRKVFVRSGYYNDNINPVTVGRASVNLRIYDGHESKTLVVIDNVSSMSPEGFSIYSESEITEMENNNVLLPLSSLNRFYKYSNDMTFTQLKEDQYRELIAEFAVANYSYVDEYFDDALDYETYIDSQEFNEYQPDYNKAYFNDRAIEHVVTNIILPKLDTLPISIFNGFSDDILTLNIVGFYDNGDLYDTTAPMITSTSTYVSIAEEYSNTINSIMYPLTGNAAEDRVLLEEFEDTATNETYSAEHYILSVYNDVSYLTSTISKVSIYLSFSVLAFSLVLQYTFTKKSIEARRTEIGIYKSLGASNTNMIQLFMTESIVIGFSVMVLAILTTYVTHVQIENYFYNVFELSISISNFDWSIILQIFIIVIASSVIATLIPLMSLMRKKPIDIIKMVDYIK